MKSAKKFLLLSLAFILILSFAACGASKSSDQISSEFQQRIDSSSPNREYASLDNVGTPAETVTGALHKIDIHSQDKIIYSGYSTIETLNFDKSLEDLLKLINESGGFIQNSNITGGDYDSIYRGKGVFRTADYTIRIPVSEFNSVTDSLNNLGNVIRSSTNAENITMQYTDSESRLEACRTKEARLLELLSKAESMEDILAIENSLSDVRYEIENLTSMISNWDSLISYSTLTVSIREVALYSKDSSSGISYGQQLKQAFVHSLYSIGQFFKDFLRFIVAAIPVLFVLAIVTIAVILVVKAVRRRKQDKPSFIDKNDDTHPKA